MSNFKPVRGFKVTTGIDLHLMFLGETGHYHFNVTPNEYIEWLENLAISQLNITQKLLPWEPINKE